jgi:protein-S-isoprenylcysteine O-methyltransferase Ste14
MSEGSAFLAASCYAALSMQNTPGTANALIRPPIALALAVAAGLALHWLYPLPLNPAGASNAWGGAAIIALGFALVVWAIVTISKAGSNVETVKPTTAIVASGPYRFTRNPIYLGMFLGLTGLAVALNSLWFLAALVAFFIVIRYGVVAREEAYLERKFAGGYLDYKARVRRWL